MNRRELVAALVSGLIFGAGLGLSGMTDPSKVIGFLDVGGDWDPSLALVMGAALGVHSLAYVLKRRMRAPLEDAAWHVPTRTDIDARLVAGAALFGLGWGIAGYCPGPAIISSVTVPGAALFVVVMVAASAATRRWLMPPA
jgi:uncharacterized membrane protein YedE/YeeE